MVMSSVFMGESIPMITTVMNGNDLRRQPYCTANVQMTSHRLQWPFTHELPPAAEKPCTQCTQIIQYLFLSLQYDERCSD